MSTITPHLWFDTQAREAAEFYTATFPDSSVTSLARIADQFDVVSFRVWGRDFLAISAGPTFTINPSISFMVNFDPSRIDDAAGRLDRIWAQLADGGIALMPLGAYPFSPRYGWIQDRYGVSWQLILTDAAGDPRPPILPALTFVGEVAGRAEEATDYYLQVFGDSERGQLARYPEGMPPDDPGTVMFTDLRLGDTWLTAMDSAHDHQFGFNEAVSLVVQCTDQAEIDHYWRSLSATPEAEQCGWLKDRFGVSWQIVPAELAAMLSQGAPDQIERVTQAFMAMKKLDLAALWAAYTGGVQ